MVVDECPICLLPLDGTLTTVGCCKKQFHTECHIKCIQQKNECPLCRSKEFIIEIESEVPQKETVNETRVQKCTSVLSYIIIGCFIILIINSSN